MSTYTGNRLSVFVQDFKALGEWLPLIKWNCLAYLITMFRSAATAVWDSSSAVWSDAGPCVRSSTFFASIGLYIYNDGSCESGDLVAKAGATGQCTIPHSHKHQTMLGECVCDDGYEPTNKGAACTACDAVSMVDGHGSSDLLNHKLFMAILFKS